MDEKTDPASNPGATTPERFPAVPGAATRFRMERLDAAAFAPLKPVAEVQLDGLLPVAATVLNVSQSGAWLRWPTGTVGPQRGERIELKLAIPPVSLWTGTATVSRVDGDRFGVSFSGLLDLDAALDVARVHAWTAPKDELEVRPWGVDGLEGLRARLGDFRMLLEDVRARTQRMEADLPLAAWQQTSPVAMQALEDRVMTDLVKPMLAVSDGIGAAYLEAGAPYARLRGWSHRLLHDLLMTSPFMARALQKPLNYAGDYVLMNYIYTEQFAGETLFGRTINLFGTRNRTGMAVWGRKEMLRDELQALLDRRAGSVAPVRILAVAAGPAQEAFELFTQLTRFHGRAELVLFEQDRGALSFAYRRLQRALAANPNPNITLQFRNDSITRLIYGDPDRDDLGSYDAIYSAGLFDYLGGPAWGRVATALGECLAPGGTLWIGNMVPECSARWFMEVHLDWHLRYRTEAETLELARRAVPGLDVEIQRDPTGLNPFARVTRRSGL